MMNQLQTKLFLGAHLDGPSSISRVDAMVPMGLALAELLVLCY